MILFAGLTDRLRRRIAESLYAAGRHARTRAAANRWLHWARRIDPD